MLAPHEKGRAVLRFGAGERTEPANRVPQNVSQVNHSGSSQPMSR